MPEAEVQAARDDLAALSVELEAAAAHGKTASKHFEAREIARASAHILALHGHMLNAVARYESLAVRHAALSRP